MNRRLVLITLFIISGCSSVPEEGDGPSERTSVPDAGESTEVGARDRDGDGSPVEDLGIQQTCPVSPVPSCEILDSDGSSYADGLLTVGISGDDIVSATGSFSFSEGFGMRMVSRDAVVDDGELRFEINASGNVQWTRLDGIDRCGDEFSFNLAWLFQSDGTFVQSTCGPP